MPYLEDGETWSADYGMSEEGMAENRPGHRQFSSYKLPAWAKHPLTHPFNGVVAGPKDYMYTAGDGFTNPLGWSIAHIGCKYGDVAILDMCTKEELSRPTSTGDLPAHYAVMYGTAWCLQKLVDLGADVTSPNVAGDTPELKIWKTKELHTAEQEWLFQAVKGELVEKNSVKAQEYRLVKHRTLGNDAIVTERLEKDMAKLRKFWFNLGDYEKPYPIPKEIAERPLDLPLSKVAKPIKKEPPLPVALLFPGQGSQYVGMLKDVKDKPAVKTMLNKAEAILGWDPLDVCLNGPEEKLSETRYCQPIMFLAGLAAVEVLREGKPECVDRPFAMAGLSLGEYTAIVAAGVLSFEDGLKLVKLRAEAMQEATNRVPQSMCSVAGLDRAKVDKLCEEAKATDDHPDAECRVANFLFPSGFTCAGTKKAVDKLCQLAVAAKALQAKVIKAGGAFHTSLMRPAQDELSRAIDDFAEKMSPPRCSIYFNLTGKRVKEGADPATFVELMKMQLTSEVMWEPTVKAMIMDGVKDFYEVGPLKQLKSMLKRIDADAFKRTENVSV
mmetsp:Transcript_16314/g.28568  ORF Transcript_16314/g.28568 Transcript_16314/m.28568 type:complete len:554 (+) Transcript_16314:56-1717(+)|eukprot:CAMPEP_0197624684 /NCGR_PEP_ID=MMETSP1338-20131121/4248_1 /TAXON_ID=43686 ORGANISM="Pelagodinium beii, Strain RCC1491" /NCGR_SAMPLE_ID=MMETSP1338 /ASSEMBLY_ACC=CAM_ASM_000754 /LENGTH=553 /DNA_ID=CAMNT_0043194877 /DNA_START=44 /DNA_END=1705 /DNA_ORIENTATION=-